MSHLMPNFDTNNLHILFQVFLCNTNHLYTIIYYQVFLSDKKWFYNWSIRLWQGTVTLEQWQQRSNSTLPKCLVSYQMFSFIFSVSAHTHTRIHTHTHTHTHTHIYIYTYIYIYINLFIYIYTYGAWENSFIHENILCSRKTFMHQKLYTLIYIKTFYAFCRTLSILNSRSLSPSLSLSFFLCIN